MEFLVASIFGCPDSGDLAGRAPKNLSQLLARIVSAYLQVEKLFNPTVFTKSCAVASPHDFLELSS